MMTRIELRSAGSDCVWVARARNVATVPARRFSSPDEALQDLLDSRRPEDDDLPPAVA